MLSRVRTIADYQFGKGVGTVVFPDDSRFISSRRGEVRQVLLGSRRLATLRAHDGRLTLGLAGAALLHGALRPPLSRVSVRDDVIPFIEAGKSVFAKHVISADPALQAGDEVLVVTSDDRLVAIGNAVMSGDEMISFMTGMAVQVRKGILQEDKE